MPFIMGFDIETIQNQKSNIFHRKAYIEYSLVLYSMAMLKKRGVLSIKVIFAIVLALIIGYMLFKIITGAFSGITP